MNLYSDWPNGTSVAPGCGRALWYAVQTRSNFEKRVATELTCKGLESYCPVFYEDHAWSDRTKTVARPLFPGYVFSRFQDGGNTRRAIVQSPGAVRIVGAGQDLSPIPDEEIEAIRKMLAGGRACAPHCYMQEGDVVRVRRGPLRDLEGILIKIKNQARLILSVTLLSRSVATEVSLTDVEVIRVSGGVAALVA